MKIRVSKGGWTTEQNKFGFVQFDRPKIENHLLTPESYESYESYEL